jgi:hypothetical protein
MVVVVAVALSQFRHARTQGRQAFPGMLGVVAIVTLSLLAGILATLLVGKAFGYVGGALAFVVLVATKRRQTPRRTAVGG